MYFLHKSNTDLVLMSEQLSTIILEKCQLAFQSEREKRFYSSLIFSFLYKINMSKMPMKTVTVRAIIKKMEKQLELHIPECDYWLNVYIPLRDFIEIWAEEQKKSYKE